MPKACDLKTGTIVDIQGMPHIVKKLETKSPSSRGAATLYKIRFTNLRTGQKLDKSYKGDDFLKNADCIRTQVQFSYMVDDEYTFMNMDDYSQYSIHKQDIEDQVVYLSEGLEGITALLSEHGLLAIELPQSVNLTVVETSPAIKGATASGRTKPATVATGLEVQVPEYLEVGEVIKINTTTGKFISRA